MASDISNISSLLQNTILLTSANKEKTEDRLSDIQAKLEQFSSVLDTDTLTKLKNGEYEISLKEYTNMNTYNTMMTALYGNSSADKFQNTLNILTNSAEDNLATAKSFVDTMRANGMSNKTAVNTYHALQKYSLMSSLGNYNFIKTSV